MVSAKDGRILLNNGKQVVIALKRVLSEVSELDLNTLADLEWCVDDLEDTFKTGLHVDKMQYPDPDDRDGQVCGTQRNRSNRIPIERDWSPVWSDWDPFWSDWAPVWSD